MKLKKHMIQLLIIILVLIVLSMSSCVETTPEPTDSTKIINSFSPTPTESLVASIDTSTPKPENSNMINEIIVLTDEEKRTISEKLFTEYKEYVDELDNKYSLYNEVMACGKLIGLQGIYRPYLTDEEIKFIESNVITNSNTENGSIYFGYLESGLFIIGLISPKEAEYIKYAPVINQIRNDDNEDILLWTLDKIPDYEDYLTIDVYIEDLSNKRDFLKYEVDLFDRYNLKQQQIYILDSDEIIATFGDYNRVISNEKNLLNEWKIHIFESKIWGEYSFLLFTGNEHITLDVYNYQELDN